MRCSPLIWLVTLVALLFSVFPSFDIEQVRAVFADGSVYEFYRVDLDGIIPRQDVAAPDVSTPASGKTPGYTHRLAQVLESPGFSAPAAVAAPGSLLTPVCHPAVVAVPVTFLLTAPVVAHCANETRGPPLRAQLAPSPSLRAPPVA